MTQAYQAAKHNFLCLISNEQGPVMVPVTPCLPLAERDMSGQWTCVLPAPPEPTRYNNQT